jgi:hypothetical protein
MIEVLPKWHMEADEKLWNAILDIVRDNNINFKFVDDSQTIKNCKDAILMRLVRISQEAQPDFPQEDFEWFKKQEKLEAEKELKSKKKTKHG